MGSKNVTPCDANGAATKYVEHGCQLGLLQMPHEITEKIMTYLTFDEISLCRKTCKQLNLVASASLNIGFTKADRLHAVIQREVKAKLPRRESERRNHPLARHVDILSAVETRLSLLSMTYSKYIDLGMCCFIPGKVLDEIYRILKFVRVTTNPPRSHELLQELRDISSMAMEHFDEKIVPSLRDRMPDTPKLRQILSTGRLGSSVVSDNWKWNSTSATFKFKAASPGVSLAVKDNQARQRQFDAMRQQLRQTRAEMRQRLAKRDRQIAEQSQKLSEQERALAELNRRIVEYDQRFDDIAAEVARVRVTDIKQKHISAPSDASSSSSSGEGSLPKHSTAHCASEASGGCQPLSASVSAVCSVTTDETSTKKRSASPQPRQSKHSKKSAGPAAATAAGHVHCLRSGRQVVYK